MLEDYIFPLLVNITRIIKFVLLYIILFSFLSGYQDLIGVELTCLIILKKIF